MTMPVAALVAVLALPFAVAQERWQYLPTTELPPRPRPGLLLPTYGLADYALTVDPHRNRLMCFVNRRLTGFGGSNFGEASTYEWVKDRWLRRHTATSPNGATNPLGFQVAAAFDPVRRRIVLTEWSGRTWLFDGDDWQELVSARVGSWRPPQLWFEPARGTMVTLVNNDLFELQATAWVPIAQIAGTAQERRAAFDPVRGEAVIFGGWQASGAPINQTWIWNGTTVTQRSPATVPPARREHTMVYDPVLGQVLVLGGSGAQTLPSQIFGWNGTNWQAQGQLPPTASLLDAAAVSHDGELVVVARGLIQTLRRSAAGTWAVSPPALPTYAASHDPTIGMTVAVDGQRTRLFDGYAWTDTGVSFPQPNEPQALAYHAGTGRTIAVDGSGGTWFWAGTAWNAVPTTFSPPGRSSPALAYDPARNRIVLFGGVSPSPRNDVFEWDGTAWSNPQPTVVPPPCASPSFAYDPVGQRLVMAAVEAGVWQWNGSNWTTIGALPGSFLRIRVGADPNLGVLLFGVTTANASVCHRLVGATWLPGPPVAHPNDFHYELVFDQNRNALLGLGPTGDQILTAVPATAVRFGVGCSIGGSAPRLIVPDVPQLGTRWRCELVDGAAAQAAFLLADTVTTSVPLPNGCTQLLPNPLLLGALPTNNSGYCGFEFVIPPIAALRGFALNLQALALDNNGALAGFADLTAGLGLRIGD